MSRVNYCHWCIHKYIDGIECQWELPQFSHSFHLTKVCFLCSLGTLLWMQCSLCLLHLSYANTVCVHYQTVFPWPFIHVKKMKIKVTCIFFILFQTTRSSKVFHSHQNISTKRHLRFLPPTNSLNKTLTVLSQNGHSDGSFFQAGSGWPILARSNAETPQPKSKLYRHLTGSVMKHSCLSHDFDSSWPFACPFLVEWDQQYLPIHLQFKRWTTLLLHSKEELAIELQASNSYGNCD